MTPLEYVARGLPLSPWRAVGKRKLPLTPNGFKDATLASEIIQAWERRYSGCLWGMPTGTVSRIVVLDIDVKDPRADGFDSLEDLGRSILPETPMVHTRTGGMHLWFECPDGEARNSASKIGPGLDVRANGGIVIVPTDGSGYTWDPHWNIDTVEPAAAPDWLWPPPPRARIPAAPIPQTDGLSKYGEAALDRACRAIIGAPAGQQEVTLNIECYSIGTLAGAGGVPEDVAIKGLLYAASRMRDHDPRWPWRLEEIDFKVRRAFADGLRHPREGRRAA